MAITLNVNGSRRSVPAEPDTPLLYVLRNDLALNGAKFGCGLAQCGACTVLIGGRSTRSCITEIGSIGDAEITTIEGLGTIEKPHPLQKAFIDEQAAQCGYCIAGMIMRAQALLDHNPAPSDTEIRTHMAPNLCRCGTHVRIFRAIRRASEALRHNAASRPEAGHLRQAGNRAAGAQLAALARASLSLTRSSPGLTR